MSSSSTHNSSSAIGPGILPTSKDFAPSVVFTVAYALLLPVVIWRCVSRDSRCGELIRPALFVPIRLATWIIRIYLSKVKVTIGLVAAESFLVSAATILIIHTLISGTRRVLETWVPRDAPTGQDRRGRAIYRDHLSTITRLLDLALLATVVMSIYGATKTGDAFSGDADALDTLSALRKGSSIVILIVVSLCVGSLFWFNQQHALPSRPVYLLMVVGLLLGVFAAYRVAAAYHASGTGSTAAFWCALALPELLVVTIFFAVNLRTFVPENPNKLDYSRTGSGVSSEGHALHPLQEQRGNRAVEHV